MIHAGITDLASSAGAQAPPPLTVPPRQKKDNVKEKEQDKTESVKDELQEKQKSELVQQLKELDKNKGWDVLEPLGARLETGIR